MTLPAGSRLGPYEIIDAIGAGGMGEVYRARDTRLDRSVAVKVLPQQFASDPDFQERFEREARSIAALNHPHICTLHDVGRQDGTSFLVMELIDGETLAERLRSGPLSLDEVFRAARQIAEALEAAHERGILHRDLKPANIKLTADGSVKVLDFGLAKLAAPSDSGSMAASRGPGFLPTNSPTVQQTLAGLIMGTAAYMSPEQARGKAVDRRTDVWAFGCVLYEMLTGKPAYDGETVTDILGAIVHKEPDWSALPPDLPPRLDELLRRCLQKDARQRLRDMGDAQLELETARTAPVAVAGTAPAASAVVPVAHWRTALPWAIAALLAVGAGVAAMAWWRETSRVLPVTRLSVEMTPKTPFAPVWGQAAVLSPDGSHIVYVAASGSERQLYLRRLDQLVGTPLSGTANATTPFFSPDGRSIGFFAGGELKRVGMTGGAPLTIATGGEGRGATWGADDTIVFSQSAVSGLFRVAAGGGTPEPVTTRDEKTERSHRWPQFLPGRNAVIFTAQLAGKRWDEANIEVVDLDSRERTIVHRGGTFGRYVPTGHLLFVREATLFALAFDVQQLEARGDPVPMVEGVAAQSGGGGSGVALFDVSANGTLVYLAADPGNTIYGPSGLTEPSSLVLVDRKGTFRVLTADRGDFQSPRFSPDGRRIAVSRFGGQPPDVWQYDTATGASRRLTFDPGVDVVPIWTPDGQRVTYYSGGTSSSLGSGLYSVAADGSGTPERLGGGDSARPGSWSPDGKVLAFNQLDGGDTGIWTLQLDGDRKPRAYLQTPNNESAPEFSPDGRWLAYTSNESGTYEVYVRAFPDTGGKWQISQGGGLSPRWSRDGRELLYRVSNDRVMSTVIPPTKGNTFQFEAPRELFRGVFAVRGQNQMWDIAPDGKQFVMVHENQSAAAAATNLTLVLNWFEDLRARVASRR